MFKEISYINLNTAKINTYTISSTIDRYSLIKVLRHRGIYNIIDVVTCMNRDGVIETYASLEDVKYGENRMIYVKLPREMTIQINKEEDELIYVLPSNCYLDMCYGDTLEQFLIDYLENFPETYVLNEYWEDEEVDDHPQNYEDETQYITYIHKFMPFGGRTFWPQYSNSENETVYVTHMSARGFNDLLNKGLYGELPPDECLSDNVLILQTEKKVINVYFGADLIDYDDPSKGRTIFFNYYDETDISQCFEPVKEWYLEDYDMVNPTIAQVAQFFETVVVPAVAKEMDENIIIPLFNY